MSARELLTDLQARGIGLRVRNGQLEVSDPGSSLTPDLRSAAVAHRSALVALLQAPAHPCSDCGRFAFPQPTVCHWCRKAFAREAA
jgi:hypothetical protein